MMKRGFTLIEVMVVLSILAIIAILAYNFFGSTMKDATTTKHATKIFRDMQLINDSYHEYIRKTGTVPSFAFGVPDMRSYQDELVDLGIIREWPEPDPDWKTDSGTCSTNVSPGGTDGWYLGYSNYGGTAETDFYSFLYCVHIDICKKFNELYTDLGTVTAVNNADVELHGGQMCSSAVGAQANMVITLGDLN